MTKKPTQESIELDEFLSELTEIEIDTDSNAIFHLCETVRDGVLFESEKTVLKSFIEWASNASLKFKESIINNIETVQNTPDQGALIPKNIQEEMDGYDSRN